MDTNLWFFTVTAASASPPLTTDFSFSFYLWKADFLKFSVDIFSTIIVTRSVVKGWRRYKEGERRSRCRFFVSNPREAAANHCHVFICW